MSPASTAVRSSQFENELRRQQKAIDADPILQKYKDLFTPLEFYQKCKIDYQFLNRPSFSTNILDMSRDSILRKSPSCISPSYCHNKQINLQLTQKETSPRITFTKASPQLAANTRGSQIKVDVEKMYSHLFTNWDLLLSKPTNLKASNTRLSNINSSFRLTQNAAMDNVSCSNEMKKSKHSCAELDSFAKNYQSVQSQTATQEQQTHHQPQISMPSPTIHIHTSGSTLLNASHKNSPIKPAPLETAAQPTSLIEDRVSEVLQKSRKAVSIAVEEQKCLRNSQANNACASKQSGSQFNQPSTFQGQQTGLDLYVNTSNTKTVYESLIKDQQQQQQSQAAQVLSTNRSTRRSQLEQVISKDINYVVESGAAGRHSRSGSGSAKQQEADMRAQEDCIVEQQPESQRPESQQPESLQREDEQAYEREDGPEEQGAQASGQYEQQEEEINQEDFEGEQEMPQFSEEVIQKF